MIQKPAPNNTHTQRTLQANIPDDSDIYQGKLDVAKQEMARGNIDLLEISELKWMGMGKFNSDDHCIYHCGQESQKKWSSLHNQPKNQKCSTCVQSQ